MNGLNLKERIKNPNFYLRIAMVFLPSIITYMTTNNIVTWQGLFVSLVVIILNPVALLTNVLALIHSFTSTIKQVDAQMDEEEKTEDEIKI